MSLLSKASLVLTPNAVKESKLYSIIPANGNGDMSVVRATTATRVNSSGIIESVALNVPRLNYDVAGGCPSILLEPQRTNLVTYSQEFDNSNWIKLNMSVTTNVANSPDNTLTSDLVQALAVSNVFIYPSTTASVSGVTYTQSFFAKAGNTDYVSATFRADGFVNTQFAVFNLSNGTISSQTGGIATITNYGNGWYRCSWTVTSTTTATTGLVAITPSFLGALKGMSVVGLNVYVWGAQAEQGAYPTSYIPTVASTVTRNADVLNRNNIYTNGLITSAGGTWFIELNNNVPLIRDGLGSEFYIGESNISSVASGVSSLSLRNAGGGSVRLTVVYWNGFSQIMLYSTTTNYVKLAIVFNGITVDIFENGIKVVTNANVPLSFGNFQYLNKLNGVLRYLKNEVLFPIPLSNAECIQLTTL